MITVEPCLSYNKCHWNLLLATIWTTYNISADRSHSAQWLFVLIGIDSPKVAILSLVKSTRRGIDFCWPWMDTLSMSFRGRERLSHDLHWAPLISLAFTGSQWPLLSFSGQSQTPVASAGLHWTTVTYVLTFIGRHWPLLTFTGRLWPLLTFTERHWRPVNFCPRSSQLFSAISQTAVNDLAINISYDSSIWKTLNQGWVDEADAGPSLTHLLVNVFGACCETDKQGVMADLFT